jgi:hypothetical protein
VRLSVLANINPYAFFGPILPIYRV